MTNKKFYSDKLLAIVIWNQNQCQLLHEMVFGKTCLGKHCGECEFSTAESIEKWLNAEHEEPEPPLLENGDGLKPGDWIMVQCEGCCDWHKMRFVCYCDKLFYTLNQADDKFHKGESYICGWEQARLPMEGE